jgi:hypothetical protein
MGQFCKASLKCREYGAGWIKLFLNLQILSMRLTLLLLFIKIFETCFTSLVRSGIFGVPIRLIAINLQIRNAY